MSATIYWEPIKSNPKSLGVGAPSAFIRTMEKAFGSDWRNLDEESIPILVGLAAAQDTDENPFQELIDLLDQYKSIRVWEEY